MMLDEEARKNISAAFRYHRSEFVAEALAVIGYVWYAKDFEWGMPKLVIVLCFTLGPVISLYRLFMSIKFRKYIGK